MKALLLISLGVLIVTGIFAEGCVSEASYSVTLRSKTGIGRYLADSRGMALYYSSSDMLGTQTSLPQSNCYGDCLARWSFFYREEVTAQPYLNSDDFTVFTRADVNKQIAYRGAPL